MQPTKRRKRLGSANDGKTKLKRRRRIVNAEQQTGGGLFESTCLEAKLTSLLSSAIGRVLDHRADELVLEACLSGGGGCSFPFPLREQFIEPFVAPFTSSPDQFKKWEMLGAVGPVSLSVERLQVGSYCVVTAEERLSEANSLLKSADSKADEFGRRVQKEDFESRVDGTFLELLASELDEEVREGFEEAPALRKLLSRITALLPVNGAILEHFQNAKRHLDADVRRLRTQITPCSVRQVGQEVLLIGHSNLHLAELEFGKNGLLRPWDDDPWHKQDIVEALQQSSWFAGGGAPVLCNDIYPSHRADLMLNLFQASLEDMQASLPLAHFRAVVICGIPLTQEEYVAGVERFAQLLRPGGQLVVSSGRLVRPDILPTSLEAFGHFRFHTFRTESNKLVTSFVRHKRGHVFVAQKVTEPPLAPPNIVPKSRRVG
eukprot:TRINITY_DN57245_c0_g1_i1.p1 TRINITY_DN57245_c0_g1~~TRINITY_DN57245_c0_g1_i1.p1  ORF type:complete len:432 (+),score=53.45 TRINITY_DN57245_c0_g1_i1:95-1390(+)